MRNKKNNYSVYYHYNPCNGKYYIGITMQNPLKRWNHGHHYRGNAHFWKAIQRDGWDNFEHVVIETGLSREMAIAMEKRLIKECDSFKHGYNNSHGGESMKGYEMAQSIKDKISESNSGEKAYWYGKKLPEYMVKKISDAHINHPDLSRSINQYDVNGKYLKTYPSVKEARRMVGHGNFPRAARTPNSLCFGYQWRYDNGDRSDIEPYNLYHIHPQSRRAVLKFDLQGNFIKQYDSISDAVAAENIKHIGSCCRGKRKTAGGFIWKYANNEEQEKTA